MTQLVIAVLAHKNRPCLEDLIGNLQTFAPNARVVLYNGGHDPDLAEGLDVEVCPYSRPLSYERLADFQFAVMRWLWEERRPFDFLLTMDSDALFIKPGFEDYLKTALRDSAYMAVDLREVLPNTTWVTGRRFHYKWKKIWQPLFGIENPYGCFNPGQVFRREYVERLLAFDKLDALLARVERSSVLNLEELIYATLAVTLDCAPQRAPIPVSKAIRYGQPHTGQEILAYLNQPDVYMIHPVTMDLQAPDRRLVSALCNGESLADFRWTAESRTEYRAATPVTKKLRTFFLTPVLSRLRDIYLQVVPE